MTNPHVDQASAAVAAARQNGLGFYGWRIVFASSIGLALCQSPIAFLTLGIFITPLSESFGWGRGDIAFALSAGALTIAFITPFAGYLIDRFGARRMILISMTGFGLLIASLGLLSPHLWHFYLIFILIGIVGSGANNTAYVRVVTAWFQKSRGLALGITTAGVGLGAAVAPMLAQYLIDTFDWRVAYAGLGFLVLFVGLPVVGLIIRDQPADMGLRPYGDAATATEREALPATTGLTASEALRSRPFWTIIFAALTFTLAIHGLQVHLVPLFRDAGIAAQTAAMLTSLVGVLSIVARVISGRLFDYIFAPYIGFVLCLCGIAAIVLLLGAPGTVWVAILVAILIGGGAGAESDLLAYVSGRYFGLRALGTLYGYVFCAVMLGTAIGPFIFGKMYDAFGSYDEVLIGAAVFVGLSGLLMLSLPRFPGKSGAGH